VELELPPVEVELPPVDVELPPVEVLVEPPVVVEVITTLPPLDPPPKNPPKKPPPKPPQPPPDPPITVTPPPEDPPVGTSGCAGSGIGMGTSAICGWQQSGSSSITRRMRFTLRGFSATRLIGFALT